MNEHEISKYDKISNKELENQLTSAIGQIWQDNDNNKWDQKNERKQGQNNQWNEGKNGDKDSYW